MEVYWPNLNASFNGGPVHWDVHRLIRSLALLGLLLAPASLSALVGVQFAWPALQEDGPYVLWEGKEATVLRVRQAKVERSRLAPPYLLALPGLAAEPLRLDPTPPPPAKADFPQPPKILAVSDAHGSFDALLALLKAQGVVDGQLRWSFGKGHLVVLGDVFDRHEKVTEILWFLRALELPAQRAGGRVHYLLGNHEAMVLRGDLRYLHPKYQELGKLEGARPVPALFGPDSELGRWIRSRPALLRLGRFLFVHGGPSPELLKRGLSLDAINAGIRRSLDVAKGADAEVDFLQGPWGPLWYRGLIPGKDPARECPEEGLDPILKAFAVKAMIVGHSTLDRAEAFHGGRVYGIDAGLMNGKPGEAWILDRGKVLRGLADGRREAF